MSIELTAEQRQALQAEGGKLMEVVDPATSQHYVLLAQDQYERVRSLLEGVDRPRPEPSPVSAQKSKAQCQRVRDLPLPPEVATAAERYCARLGFRKENNRRQIEEQMKLQHFYGGKWIAYLRTSDGPVVVAVADSVSDPSFEQQISCLSAEERRRAVIDSPGRLFDKESEILTPFADENQACT